MTLRESIFLKFLSLALDEQAATNREAKRQLSYTPNPIFDRRSEEVLAKEAYQRADKTLSAYYEAGKVMLPDPPVTK